MKRSHLELQFEALLLDTKPMAKLGSFVTEWKFHPKRKWRFDFAFVPVKIAIEIEGGAWLGKGHTSGKGYHSDMEKYNAAVLLGWRVLRYSGETMTQAIEDLKKLL